MYMIAEVSQYVAVASFAEAWIEINISSIIPRIFSVASFAEAWIEIKKGRIDRESMRRLLRGGVD